MIYEKYNLIKESVKTSKIYAYGDAINGVDVGPLTLNYIGKQKFKKLHNVSREYHTDIPNYGEAVVVNILPDIYVNRDFLEEIDDAIYVVLDRTYTLVEMQNAYKMGESLYPSHSVIDKTFFSRMYHKLHRPFYSAVEIIEKGYLTSYRMAINTSEFNERIELAKRKIEQRKYKKGLSADDKDLFGGLIDNLF